jgi:hypothetical protein
MSKPFQFSMRRMLGAMTCFAAAAYCFSVCFTHVYDAPDWLSVLSYVGAIIFPGAGIGTICGRTMMGILWACICLILLFIFMPVVVQA